MKRATATSVAVMLLTALVLRAQAPALLPGEAGAAVPLPAADGGKSAANGEPPTVEQLQAGQQRLAESFEQFQAALVRWSELSRLGDRRRAAALRRAIEQSQEKRIAERFAQTVELLQQGRLADAMLRQQSLERDLNQLLETLLRELSQRDHESLKEQLERIRKEIGLILRKQKQLQGRTAGREPPPLLAGEQGALAEQTDRLAQQMRKQEGAEEASSGKSTDTLPREQSPQANRQGSPGKPSPDRSKPSEGASPQDARPSEGGQQSAPRSDQRPSGTPPSPSRSPEKGRQQASPPSEQQPEHGPSARSEQSSGEPASPQSAARQRLEQAQQHMRRAEDQLRQAERSGASEEQEEAIRQLEKAKAQLEEILRQMRKDEIRQLLAALEARFRRMLLEQRDILTATTALDEVPAAKRDHAHRVAVGQLGSRQAKQVQQGENTLTLLREDGSSAAFAETTAQLCDDLRELVALFADADVGRFNQSLQEDVIRTLEEMIEALKQAQRDLDERSEQSMQSAQPGEMPLVNLLAEIKMIRTLQLRVNRRTKEYGKLLSGGPTNAERLREALGRLADRQQQVAKITRDLYLKKNR